VEEGADIIDVGGQSAITNRPEVDAEHEAGLVLPIVEGLHEHHPEVLVSVDTFKPMVVDAVLDAGAGIINDVSGLLNPEIAGSCARHEADLAIMHTAAKPKLRLQRQDLYVNVVKEVATFLEERLKLAVAQGLAREAVILDPGPDFPETPHQTVTLLRGIDEIERWGGRSCSRCLARTSSALSPAGAHGGAMQPPTRLSPTSPPRPVIWPGALCPGRARRRQHHGDVYRNDGTRSAPAAPGQPQTRATLG